MSLGVLRHILKRLLHRGIGFTKIEALARLKTNLPKLHDDRLVGNVRRMELEQFCCIGEELACGHCIDLLLGWGTHIDVGINLHRYWLWLFSPPRQRRDLVASLNLVDGFIIRGSISLGSTDDPDIWRRRFNLRELRRELCRSSRTG